MKKCLFPAAVALSFVAGAAFAAVKPSPMFSDNMVLQRDREVKIWGTADPGEPVTVVFDGQSVRTEADAAGDWEVTLAPMDASKEDRPLLLKGAANEVTLQNVLVGDVWLCSGQSNMEMSFGWGIIGGETFQAEAAGFPIIRNMKIRKVIANYPQKEAPVERQWNKASDVWGGVTATGYFFARKLVQELDVPIGLIDDSWSGCRIEPFACVEGMKAVEAEHIASRVAGVEAADPATEAGRAKALETLDAIAEWVAKTRPVIEAGGRPADAMPAFPSIGHDWTAQYNAMVAPLVRYAIKGALWYQGCSNGGEGDEYIDKMEALILGWRAVWGYDFPFYYVQLASFMNQSDNPAGGDGYARIRDAQRKTLARVPKTGMAVTLDIGNGGDIHPKEKLHVGERLAVWALAKDYGQDVVFTGPLFKGLEIDGARAIVSFEDDSVGSGLMVGMKNHLDNDPPIEAPEGTEIEGFAIAGEDRQWQWATAQIDGDTVIVTSPLVEAPVAVRYAYRANPLGKCNLYNREGLPASPFRTDDW
ncbi:MAG: sialate O-acetylesterase [Kiritimatiellia bacterium]